VYNANAHGSAMTTPVNIPKRAAYKAADVCSIVELQPYVLRTWEAEFPDLGVPQSNGRSRVYRRADIEKVIRIKELIVVEGLTLGAARRKLAKEASADDEPEPLLFGIEGDETRAQLEKVKSGLRSLLVMLSGPGDDKATMSESAAASSDGESVAPPNATAPTETVSADTRPPSRRAKPAQKRA
jgi:DNA-binding transcriptional MerR regulator